MYIFSNFASIHPIGIDDETILVMAKHEYIEANRKWLEEKAKEEGVKALPGGVYYKVLKQGDSNGRQPSRHLLGAASLQYITPDGLSTARSLIPVVAGHQ